MNDTLLDQINSFIDARIRPFLLANAGDITIISLESGTLYLRLEGRCAGCASAWLTATEAVKQPLLHKFPALSDVIVQAVPTK